jgi:hypothetical protein
MLGLRRLRPPRGGWPSRFIRLRSVSPGWESGQSATDNPKRRQMPEGCVRSHLSCEGVGDGRRRCRYRRHSELDLQESPLRLTLLEAVRDGGGT